MKRYAICAIVGTGTSEEDMLRPKVANYSVNWSMVSSDKPWTLALVAAGEGLFTELDDDIDIVLLDCGPDELDELWEECADETDREMINAWTGYTTSAFDTCHDVIVGLGLSLDPNFILDNFNVSE